jgi:hypothetical protein
MKDDEIGVWVSSMVKEPRKDFCVQFIHPMRFAWLDFTLVLVGVVVGLELCKHSTVFDGLVDTVVSIVFLTDLNGEGNISDIIEVGSIRMSGHHGCSCKIISHSWCHLIDTITTSRVAGNKNFIYINEVID